MQRSETCPFPRTGNDATPILSLCEKGLIMFTKEDILTLAKAGFTAEQIIALNGINAKTEEPKQEEPKPAEVKSEEPKQEEPKAESFPELEQALNRLNDSVARLQNFAIAGSNQPAKPSTEDILASIINPPKMSAQ